MTDTDYEKYVDAVLEEFDFAKVERVMAALDWRWLGEPVPAARVRAAARRKLFALRGQPAGTSLSSGGLVATIYRNCIDLKFVVTSTRLPDQFAESEVEMPVWDGQGEPPGPPDPNHLREEEAEAHQERT